MLYMRTAFCDRCGVEHVGGALHSLLDAAFGEVDENTSNLGENPEES